ncbi:MAG: hypothetical protein IJB00_07065 [Akkermansia sp.]|nr:hypothetical protein [Akkermansia sp.]
MNTITAMEQKETVLNAPQNKQAQETESPLPDTVLWVNWEIPTPPPPGDSRPDTPERETPEAEPDALPGEVKALAPPPAPQETVSWYQVERGKYWNRILTADPDTIPQDIRAAAGAEDETQSPEEREYHLLRTVNRSWAADHLGYTREQVRADWGNIRRELADRLGVAGNEQEVFTSLSLRAQEAPLRELARSAYEQEYLRVLEGREDAPPDAAEERSLHGDARLGEIRRMARAAAEADREECMQHADALQHVVRTFSQMERGPVQQVRAVWNSPQFLQAVDELAELPAEKRAVLYRVVQAEWKKNGYTPLPEPLPVAMLHSMVRGGVNMSLDVGQALGNVAVAQLGQLGESLGVSALSRFSECQDKRLQMLEELRRVAQQEVIPIHPGQDASFAEELLVDMAGAVPGVALAFAGAPGVSLLAAASAGASVADARQRAPEGSQKLQTAAGCLAGATQAAIFRGMSGLGQRLISRTINRFAGSVGQGARKYALAALQAGAQFTQHTVNLLLAGKAVQAAELGLQELAARADETASHIDWAAYGDNLLDVETNIREAAMNLPFVLIAGGKAALHHFRSPRTVLGDGHRLDAWGVDPAMKERVMNAPTLQQQSELLREALRSSKCWSGAGFLSEIAAKSLRLLQTKDLHLFDNEQVVAQFLSHPGEQSVLSGLLRRSAEPGNGAAAVPEPPHAHLRPRKGLPAGKAPWLNAMMQSWLVKAGMLPGQHINGRAVNLTDSPAGRQSELSPLLHQKGYYLPQAERIRRGKLAELVHAVEQISYRFLLNTYTIDTLHRSFASEKQAQERTETLRRRIPELAARAVLQCVLEGNQAAANSSLKSHFSEFYGKRRFNSIREPWLQKASSAHFREMVDMVDSSQRIPRRYPEEAGEMRRQYLGLTSAVRELAELIPHMEDFHTLLSRGYSPLGAYAAILEREFSLSPESPDWKPDGWEEPLSHPAEAALQQQTDANMKKMKQYELLTGRKAEMVTKSSGEQLWRIRRPDGTPTRWHESAEHVANDMAYVYTLRLGMPYAKDVYAARLAENMRVNGVDFAGLLTPQRRRISTHDALGCIALQDLHEQWLGNAAVMQPGLGYHRREFPGLFAGLQYDGVAAMLRPGEKNEPPRHYLLDPKRTVNPLNLMFARAQVYWQRMLDSSTISPAEAAEFLEKQGEISPRQRQELLRMPEVNHRLYRLPELREMTRKRRHRYVRHLRELLRNREHADLRSALAEHLSYFSVNCLVADIERAPLPNSVKEWIAAAPFRAQEHGGSYRRPALISKVRGSGAHARDSEEFLVRWMNDKASEYLLSHGERIAALRDALQDEHSELRQSPFYGRLRELWEPSDAQRKEQSWCYLLGGDRYYFHAGQELWNLLREPNKAWERMPAAQQELLRRDLLPVVREHPAPGVSADAPDALEQNLLNLHTLLQEKPQLREFSLNPRMPGEILRLRTDSPPMPQSSRQHAEVPGRAELFRRAPELMRVAGTPESVSLPPELAADARVMPALHLLTALRYQVADYPTVTPEGIRWRNQYYGGESGVRPKGMTENWVPEKPLGGLLDALQRLESGLAEQGSELVGEQLKPLSSELDLSPLQHVTVYRNDRFPAVQVRLMPGDFASSSVCRSRPYVVHSLAGAPMGNKTGWRPHDDVSKVYQDLVHFDSNPERGQYDEQAHRAGGFFAMVFNQLHTRLMSAQALRLGRDADLSNREIIMHLAQDTGYSDKLAGVDISTLTPDEVVTLSLFRQLLAYEYGTHPEAAESELLRLGARFRTDNDLFEQVKENVLDSGEYGLDLIDALRLADENLIRREDGSVILKHYSPNPKPDYRKTDLSRPITQPRDYDGYR